MTPKPLLFKRPSFKYSEKAFAQKLFGCRWAMKKEDLNSLCLKYFNAFDLDDDDDGQQEELPVSTYGDISVIPIYGTLVNHMEGTGIVNYDWIREQVYNALSDQDVKTILLYIDSPGGEVIGCQSTADFIAEANNAKPIIAYTSGLMCSAAYWIGSQASKLYSSIDADIGSVGVFSSLPNIRKMLEKQGIKMNVFASHPDKVAGQPAIAMSDKHKGMFQADVDEEYSNFLNSVNSKRTIAINNLTGWDYSGTRALSFGFTDGIIPTIEEALAFLS